MLRNVGSSSVLVAAFLAGTALAAQTPPQFKADLRMTGGSLDGPATGTMYFGGSKVRLELTADGQAMVLIVDPELGTQYMLMPAERMYMEMPAGMAPLPTPDADSMDPTDPCAGGEVTDCVALGEEEANGYPAMKWEYVSDGEKVTSWIATSLRFPVRIVSADGTTTDYSNVVMGPQPSSLFEIPDGFQGMDMGMGMGMMGGRGGRGGMPGMGGMGGMGGMRGMDPTSAAVLQAMADAPDASAWEAVDHWVLDVTITATEEETGTEMDGLVQWKGTYSVRYTGSIPLNYGTPAVRGATGPAWQHIPSLGSESALAEPLTLSAESSYQHEWSRGGDCVNETPMRTTYATHAEIQGTTGIREASTELMAQARMEISGDLKTYSLLIGVGSQRPILQTKKGRTDVSACPDQPASTEVIDEATEIGFSVSLQNLQGLPLPASPATLTGSQTAPIPYLVDGRNEEADGDVQWTLRPVGGG